MSDERPKTFPTLERLREAVLASDAPQCMALLALSFTIGVCLAAGSSAADIRRWLELYLGKEEKNAD